MAGSRFGVPYETAAAVRTAVYGVAPAFDFDAGDIQLDGAGRVVMADARQTWLAWCVKSVLTEKGAYMAYPGGVGANMCWAMEQTGRAAQQEAIVNALTDALLADPSGRTLSVSDFAFEWSADSVQASFTLLGADGWQERVSAALAAQI